MPVSIERLNDLLECDPSTGALVWLPRDGQPGFNARFAGKPALQSRHACGYLWGSIDSRLYMAHRVIWAMAHGAWPEGPVDHINGDRSDNRIANLRCVDAATNGRNQAKPKNNTSGAIGVSFHRATQKWMAGIRFMGKRKHLGVYARKEDAIRAYNDAMREYGFHANHGRAA